MKYIKYKGRVYRAVDAVMTGKEVRSQRAKEKNYFKELQKELTEKYASEKNAEIQKIDGELKKIQSEIKKLHPADLKRSSNPILIEQDFKNLKNWTSSARKKLKEGKFDSCLIDLDMVNRLLSKTPIKLDSIMKEIKNVK